MKGFGSFFQTEKIRRHVMSTKLDTNLNANSKQKISLDDLARTDIIQELSELEAAKINGGRVHKSSTSSPYGPNGKYLGFLGY
jgi:hypothetical protein